MRAESWENSLERTASHIVCDRQRDWLACGDLEHLRAVDEW